MLGYRIIEISDDWKPLQRTESKSFEICAKNQYEPMAPMKRQNHHDT